MSGADVVDDEEHVPTLSIEDVRNQDISFDQLDLTHDEARLAINAISSQAIAAEEASVGNFARRKLKRLSTWPLWEAGDIAYSIS